MDERKFELLKTLPPLVACIVWDVLNKNITPQTIQLAGSVTDEEWQAYEVVRCIGAGNPKYPPTEEAQVLVDIMMEMQAVK